ncbi:hypothetical protein [Sphingomonas crocodyli]|nr:hypothetical protein [Sphingomonas crocodyli]
MNIGKLLGKIAKAAAPVVIDALAERRERKRREREDRERDGG